MRKLRKKLKFEAPGIVSLKEEAKAAGVCEGGSIPDANDQNCDNGPFATETGSTCTSGPSAYAECDGGNKNFE